MPLLSTPYNATECTPPLSSPLAFAPALANLLTFFALLLAPATLFRAPNTNETLFKNV